MCPRNLERFHEIQPTLGASVSLDHDCCPELHAAASHRSASCYIPLSFFFFLHCVVPEQWPLRSELFRPPLPHSNHKVWSPAHPIIPLSCFLYQRERTRGGSMNIKCVFWSADSSRVWNCGALRLKAETAGKVSWMEGCSFNSMPETRLKKTESWCTAYVQSPVHNSTQYLWYYYWDVTSTVTQNRSYFITLFLIKPCVPLKEQFIRGWSFPPSKKRYESTIKVS